MMADSNVYLLNLELEAAAARNADLSKQLERLTDELTCSTVHQAERPDVMSRGVQTERDTSRNVALDLDDLLFEMAEMMFRLYPSTPIDLSSRQVSGWRDLEELSQRCLREMHALRTALDTKIDGYNKFIDDLQKSLGEYYRTIDSLESQLQVKDAECSLHVKENTQLSRKCLELENQLQIATSSATTASENIKQLAQQTKDLETDKQQLVEREKVLINTVESLRKDLVQFPQHVASAGSIFSGKGNTKHLFLPLLKEIYDVQAPSTRPSVNESRIHNPKSNEHQSEVSLSDIIWACQGSAKNKAFPVSCVSSDKLVDFCLKKNSP